jgi:hypothetical protein
MVPFGSPIAPDLEAATKTLVHSAYALLLLGEPKGNPLDERLS